MGTSYEDAPTRYQYRLPQEENVFSCYFSVFEKIIKKIEIPFKLKGTFRDENPPQAIAIREALVNLLMHTDYFSSAKPRIRVFLDRIEFFNPGALPKDIKGSSLIKLGAIGCGVALLMRLAPDSDDKSEYYYIKL